MAKKNPLAGFRTQAPMLMGGLFANQPQPATNPKPPDDSGDWYIAGTQPGKKRGSATAMKGISYEWTMEGPPTNIWKRKSEKPKTDTPAPTDDKFKGSSNLHEARERADQWRANYRLGDEQNIRDLGGDYGDRPDFTQPDVFNTLYALGQRGNTRHRYRYIPQMNDEGILQAMETGESSRYHLQRSKGKVGTITDPFDLYSKLKGDVKV